MITKEEYIQARKIVNEYETQERERFNELRLELIRDKLKLDELPGNPKVHLESNHVAVITFTDKVILEFEDTIISVFGEMALHSVRSGRGQREYVLNI